MNDETLDSPSAIQAFLAGAHNIQLSMPKAARYAWIARVLKRTRYGCLSKQGKGIVREYIQRVTGYSLAQTTRLIGQYQQKKWIGAPSTVHHRFASRYTRSDILLLAEMDEAHQTLSGGLTKKLFERAHQVYKDASYERLAAISIAHIYNLRKSKTYQTKRRYFKKTQRSAVQLGERRKPKPNGCPGYLRIDTVHQGDQDKKKGVYHINAVDEVTQYEVIFSVEKISERYLIPVLACILDVFPFEVKGFHSDNGSEYMNDTVAKLLKKLFIEFTKSRARHSNDNALVESKNGSIVRKVLGYVHIPQTYAPLINAFHTKFLIPYINFHRPCYFPEVKYDKKGKEKKYYPYPSVMTPYEKLKSLPNAKQYLKPGITFDQLDQQAMAISDLEAARQLQKNRKQLFETIFKNESVDNA